MWLGIEQRRIDAVMGLDVFLGQDRAACSNPANQRQTELFAQRVLELNAPGCTRYQFENALFLQGAEVLLSGIGGLETKLLRDFRSRRWHAVIINK